MSAKEKFVTDIHRRSEWRGDFFASELPALDRRIGELQLPHIVRPHKDTATIFLTPSADVTATPLRLRGYGDFSETTDLLDIDPDHGVWRLERKEDTTKQLLAKVSISGVLGDDSLQPQVVRLASRNHFQLGDRDDGVDETRRLTVDASRRVFAVGPDYRTIFLGDLGPRVEVKTPTEEETTAWVDRLILQDLAAALPNRSLELYMQHILRGMIHKNTYAGHPELEAKFSVANQDELAMAYAAITAQIRASPDIEPLLPQPSEIVRMRRYHVCRDSAGNDVTVVETAAGRLSLKQKTNPRIVRVKEAVILERDTVASHTTDLNGSTTDLETYLLQHGLSRLVTYEKHQRKLPFAYNGGNAFHVSMDLCTRVGDPTDRLAQIELEFIGSIASRPRLDDLYTDMGNLTQTITDAYSSVSPSVLDKQHHFAT